MYSITKEHLATVINQMEINQMDNLDDENEIAENYEDDCNDNND